MLIRSTIQKTTFISATIRFRPIRFLCFVFWLAFIFVTKSGFCQKVKIDSLRTLLKNGKPDTLQAKNLRLLSYEYDDIGKTDSAFKIAERSLKLALQTKEQTSIIRAYKLLGVLNDNSHNFSSAEKNFEKALKLCDDIKHKDIKAELYNCIGSLFHNQGNYLVSNDYFLKSLTLYEELKDKDGIGACLGNIGIIYNKQGNYSKALEYDLKALEIYEGLADQDGIATNLGNIGNIYMQLEDYPKAKEYYLKTLKIYETMGSKRGISNLLNNIGGIYREEKKIDKALEYFFKALKIRKEIGDEQGVAYTLGNIGIMYQDQGDYLNAETYHLQALEIKRKINDKNGMSNTLNSLGALYVDQKKYKDAKSCLNQAVEFATEIGSLWNLVEPTKNLRILYARTGNYKKAYEYLKEYHKIKDSLYSIEKQKDITRKEMNYEFEKKEALTKAEHDKQIAIAEADKKRQRLFSGLILAIAASITIIAVIIFRSLRISKKQKHIIEKQKALVEEHQKEIIDSITYAKRIQDAILPPLETVKQKLPNSFVLYKPKDIVAGDFYWMEEFDNIIFIAAADCTGHGVPGAMVSLVCSNALTRAVKEFGLRDTGLILDKVRALVLETFEKSAEDVKDGMDISLLSIDQQHKIIHWSGANNPLWYIEKNLTSSKVASSNVLSSGVEKKAEKNVLSSEVEKEVEKNTETTPKSFEVKVDVSAETVFKFFEVKADVSAETLFKFFEVKADVSAETLFKFFEVKADKQPIGKTENPKPFTTHNIEFKEGTEFYLFTDGLADQFGGPLGKKYKYKQFENLLTNNYILGHEEQVKKIELSFEDWKGNLEQVDDVCVIGLRI